MKSGTRKHSGAKQAAVAAKAAGPCDGGAARTRDGERTVSLGVLKHVSAGSKASPIRQSKMGRRRAIVLAAVQGLLIAHIVLWLLSQHFGWFGGVTLTPIEPSESMEFSKRGVINAGLIFFALALLSTLILGRWFCGWGCHVVLLQDLCAWMMKKVGIRPKPFRSRLLIYVPLALAIYMFILPVVHRWLLLPLDGRLVASLGADNWLVVSIRAVSGALGFPIPFDLQPWKVTSHLTTEGFWDTFVGPVIAVPFLFICGFASVYFLGAKGFCTYGCPYGGFFAPVDRYAPGRIRVTDDCEQCGHCTAVCTSNVRVHDEVREFGMVVDPGCMKCMDCVSVCPNDALYFGFGRPAVSKGAPKNEAPKRKYDLSWPEEIGLAIVFLGSFVAVRGIYGLVPMLMAVGIAGVVTYLVWKLWRMLRDANVNLHRYRLKSSGRLNPSGWVFATTSMLFVLLVAHSGVVQAAFRIAEKRASAAEELAMSADGDAAAVDDAAKSAIGLYSFVSSVADGGIALMRSDWQTGIDYRIAYMQAVRGDVNAAVTALRDAVRRGQLPNNIAMGRWTSQLLLDHGDLDSAAIVLEHMIEIEPAYSHAYGQLAGVRMMQRRLDDAETVLRSGLEQLPDDPLLNSRLGEFLQVTGRSNEAEPYLKRAESGAVGPEPQ